MEKNNSEHKEKLIRWDPEEKIIYIKVLHNISDDDAKRGVDAISEIFSRIPENETIKILADVSYVDKGWNFSARRVYTNMIKKYKERQIKAAIIGANTTIKIMTSFFVGLGREKNLLEFFDNKEKALEWLKER